MNLIDQMKEKYEKVAIEGSDNLKEQRIAEQESVNNASAFSKTDVDKEYVLHLRKSIRDKDGNYKHFIRDYFISDVRRKDLFYGQSFKVVKISGDHFGETFDCRIHSSRLGPVDKFTMSEVELFIDGERWIGYACVEPYVPFQNVQKLNEYSNRKNQELIADYERKVAQDKENIVYIDKNIR